MRPKTDASGDLVCPMPGCGEVLLLVFTEAIALHVDVINSTDPIRSSNATTGTWKVECLNDHVILVPDTTGCLCEPEDQQEDDVCPHDPDDYEWSEEGPMQFRAFDRVRLIAFIERLGGMQDPKPKENP